MVPKWVDLGWFWGVLSCVTCCCFKFGYTVYEMTPFWRPFWHPNRRQNGVVFGGQIDVGFGVVLGVQNDVILGSF